MDCFASLAMTENPNEGDRQRKGLRDYLARNAKEKICLVMFSPSECKLVCRLQRTIGMS
jgi:hypothetical protein